MADAIKITVYAVEMSDEMAESAKKTATEALGLVAQMQGVSPFGAIAGEIRKEFDKRYNRNWNCVVGRSFGAFVTHRIREYIYFSLFPGLNILLWR